MEEKDYYLFDKERNLLWKKRSIGYTKNLAEAQVYTKEEALIQVSSDYGKNTVLYTKEQAVKMIIDKNCVRLLTRISKEII